MGDKPSKVKYEQEDNLKALGVQSSTSYKTPQAKSFIIMGDSNGTSVMYRFKPSKKKGEFRKKVLPNKVKLGNFNQGVVDH